MNSGKELNQEQLLELARLNELVMDDARRLHEDFRAMARLVADGLQRQVEFAQGVE